VAAAAAVVVRKYHKAMEIGKRTDRLARGGTKEKMER